MSRAIISIDNIGRALAVTSTRNGIEVPAATPVSTYC